MNKSKKSSISSTKKMTIASIVAAVTFVAFAGFTAHSVINVSDIISKASFADKDGIPTLWSDATFSSPVSISTEVKSAGDHLSYLTTIENRSTTSELYLTDLASRVSDSAHTGFISFDSESLEYSYSNNSPSWYRVYGANVEGTYQLANAIKIGPSGSSSSRIYLRYNLSPASGNVTDKISFRIKNNAGDYSVAVSDSSIAYEETAHEIVAVENNRTDDNSGESAFAEPLGVYSESSNLSSIATSSATLAAISPESITASTIIIIAVLGIFAGSLIAFLVIKNHHAKKAAVRK
ncbi:hypothetical protein IKF94_02600 [Candidatus Saccharibacteria bacterium]|nr:hypothetical protein [Candidatus Saccharibacteria bacterium]